ncbi:MAG: carbohydrate ABC transporter permease, partial [Bacteroidota bacterium]
LGDPRGLIQLIVQAFGGDIPSTQWYLRGPSIAWMAIMFQNIFTTAPTFMIMFLAALQDINPALYEAAALDGANSWQQFRKITLPLLRPIILLVVVLGTIGTLQVFDQVYLATSGGPLGTSLTPVFLIYREALGILGPIQMGYAAAMAFILGAIIFFFTFLQRRFIERETSMY